MKLINLLSQLCRVPAPSGREQRLRLLIKSMLAKTAHSIHEDRSGNLQAWLNPGASPCLMLDAHMDEVGLMVQDIEENGCLRIVPIGGLEARLMPGTRVLLQLADGQDLPGIVGAAPPHVGKSDEPAWDNFLLDIGATNKVEAQTLNAEIGLCGVLDAGQGILGADSFYARNLDNRVGCALLVWLAGQLAGTQLSYSICFNFSTGEEVGLRGATTAAYHINPDLALVLEATVGDTPGLPAARQPSYLGQGPAITIMDRGQIVPLALVHSLEAAAKKAKVQCQRKRPPSGGNDGGAIALSRSGVPTASLSVPCRYIHSPVALLRISDLEATAKLLKQWVLHHRPWPNMEKTI